MWRSRARALLRSLHSHSRIEPQPPCKTLILTQTPRSQPPLPSRLVLNPRSYSAANPSFGPPPESSELGIEDGAAEPSATSTWSFDEPDESEAKFDFDENVGASEAPAWDFGDPDGSPVEVDGEADKGNAFGEIPQESGDSSLLEEGGAEAEAEVAEITAEQIESVVSILKDSSGDNLRLRLDELGLALSEELVVKVIEASSEVGGNLIGFYKWALESEESVKTLRTIELLVLAMKSYPEFTKKEAYMLWDLIKELGKEKWVLNTEILNELISTFWKLGKAKAGLEVFDKFDEFGCSPDGDSYYYTIQALGRRSMFDTAWSVCDKMLTSGSLPSSEKVGDIITFFCKGKKTKEAHLVYLMAKEKKLSLQRSSLEFLICGLARSDETVPLAAELLNDYPKEYKHANKTFSSVVKGLCRINKIQEAKELLLRMVKSGPAPGNASFNYVINGLSKGGEVEDAVALMKVMEDRGLRPDVYTYTVVMSGYAKGGLMDEAYKLFCEAKKRHAKLSPATYHVLTRGYCKMEEFEKALECMNEMKEHGVQPNADEYEKMIVSLCLKSLDWRKAEKLLEEMKARGLYLKGVTRSLIAAVRELEEEETQPEEVSIEA